MKRSLFTVLLLAAAWGSLAMTPGRAQEQLSARNLDEIDRLGWLTPGFKSAVHEYVETKQAIADTQKETKDLKLKLPDLQKQVDDAKATIADLKKQLVQYDHTEQSDYTDLQQKMADANAAPEDQRMLAQAFVWAYPGSTHQSEAQQDLQQVEKKIADAAQAAKDAEAARVAAYAKLVQRAQAKDLSLEEWRGFLNNMAQEDVLKYIGQPNSQGPNFWNYTGAWTEDTTTHQKVGLTITFNAARVISVAELPNE